jgi:hypothetical protein
MPAFLHGRRNVRIWGRSGNLLSALAAATAGKSHRVGAAIKRLRRESGDLIETLGFRCEPSWNGGT